MQEESEESGDQLHFVVQLKEEADKGKESEKGGDLLHLERGG